MTGITSVSYSFFLVLIDIVFDLHIFLSPPNIAEARLILRLIAYPLCILHLLLSGLLHVDSRNLLPAQASLPPVSASSSRFFAYRHCLCFSPLVFSPSLLLLFWTLSVSSCSWCLSSAITCRSTSSANLRLNYESNKFATRSWALELMHAQVPALVSKVII